MLIYLQITTPWNAIGKSKSYLQLIPLLHYINLQNPISFFLLQITNILRHLNDLILSDLARQKIHKSTINSNQKQNSNRTQLIKLPSWVRSEPAFLPLAGTTPLPTFHILGTWWMVCPFFLRQKQVSGRKKRLAPMLKLPIESLKLSEFAWY